jgi:uncharacterized membrane protein YqiK
VQQIETLKAAQVAEVVQRKADSELASTRARIEMEQRIRTADLERERSIRAAEIAQQKALAEAEIARERDVALAEQQRQIAVLQQSEAESQARAAADTARAAAVRAAEAVPTAKQVAEAERRKAIALLGAQQESEIAGTRARLAAQTEAVTAGDRASARVQAAQADADASALRTGAMKAELMAQAEGRRALAEAENAMDDRVVAMRVELAKLEALPRVVAEMVKPAEKIDSIRIHHVSGLGGAAGGAGDAVPRAPVNQALDSIMEMAVQLPALKKLGEDLGMSLDSGLAGVTRPLSDDVRQP